MKGKRGSRTIAKAAMKASIHTPAIGNAPAITIGIIFIIFA